MRLSTNTKPYKNAHANPIDTHYIGYDTHGLSAVELKELIKDVFRITEYDTHFRWGYILVDTQRMVFDLYDSIPEQYYLFSSDQLYEFIDELNRQCLIEDLVLEDHAYD